MANNFFNESSLSPEFSGTNGQATILFLSGDDSINQHDWELIYQNIKKDAELLNTLLIFSTLPLIFNTKSSIIIDNKEILKDFFTDEHQASHLIKHTLFALKNINDYTPQDIFTFALSKFNHNLEGKCYLGYGEDHIFKDNGNISRIYFDNVTRAEKQYIYNVVNVDLIENCVNILIDKPIAAKSILSLLTAEDIYNVFPIVRSYDSWSNLRDLHKAFNNEQYEDLKNLNSLIYNNTFDSFDNFFKLQVKDNIINLFNLYHETKDEHFLALSNKFLKKICINERLSAFIIFNQLESILTTDELKLVHNYSTFKQNSEHLILSSEGNLIEINGLKILLNIQDNDKCSEISKFYTVSSLEEKISKHIQHLSELDECKDIKFLQSVNFYSSKISDSLIVAIKPSLDLSKEQLIKMIEEFLNDYLFEYLFSKNNTSYNNSIIYFENQHLQHTIPFKESTPKSLKF